MLYIIIYYYKRNDVLPAPAVMEIRYSDSRISIGRGSNLTTMPYHPLSPVLSLSAHLSNLRARKLPYARVFGCAFLKTLNHVVRILHKSTRVFPVVNGTRAVNIVRKIILRTARVRKVNSRRD